MRWKISKLEILRKAGGVRRERKRKKGVQRVVASNFRAKHVSDSQTNYNPSRENPTHPAAHIFGGLDAVCALSNANYVIGPQKHGATVTRAAKSPTFVVINDLEAHIKQRKRQQREAFLITRNYFN